MKSTTIVVIPCFNEASRLQSALFTAFARVQPGVRFLFVDDGSTDRTWHVLEGLHQDDPEHFAICHLPENCGKAEAVRQGVLRAFRARSSYIGYWDADLATPLATIPAFQGVLDTKPDVELVCGVRLGLLGHVIERRALRQWLGRLFACAAALTLGLRIHDPQCGAKLFRASPGMHALFHDPFATRWLGDVELLARLIQARRGTALLPGAEVIFEYVLDEWHERSGSHVKGRDFATSLCGLVRIAWRQ